MNTAVGPAILMHPNSHFRIVSETYLYRERAAETCRRDDRERREFVLVVFGCCWRLVFGSKRPSSSPRDDQSGT
jgi:hypothetical protein